MCISRLFSTSSSRGHIIARPSERLISIIFVISPHTMISALITRLPDSQREIGFIIHNEINVFLEMWKVIHSHSNRQSAPLLMHVTRRTI